MLKCSTQFVLLEAPLTLAELARHLATGKNFLLHPCGISVVRALEVVAQPYGYEVIFDADEEIVCLRRRGTAESCVCTNVSAHLSATEQLRLHLRQ